MQEEKEILVQSLDLMPGYRAEQDGTVISLVDPEGRRVARLPDRAVSKEPVAPDQERQDLCEALLMLAYSHFVECKILRERVEKLEKQLRKVEEERDTSDRIAEDLYEFFSRTTQRIAKHKRAGERGLNGG